MPLPSITTAAELADSTNTYITEMRTTASTLSTNLLGIGPVTGAVTNPTAFIPYADWAAAISGIIAKPTINVTDLATIGTINTTTVNDLTAYSAWVAAPTLITAPDLVTYNTTKWNETYWSNLKSGIDAFINNISGTDDIDSVLTKLTSETDKLQVAFFAQDLERKQQVLRDMYSAANSSTGNRGFLFPNSMTVALKLDAQQKFQFDLSQTSRDLIKFLFDWSKSNWQFTVDKGISAHNSDIDFNIRYCDTLLKSYATELNGQLDKYKAEISQEINKAKTAIEEYSVKIDGVIKKYALSVDKAKVAMEFDKHKIDILSEYDKIRVTAYTTEANNTVASSKGNNEISLANVKHRMEATSEALRQAVALGSSASQVALGVL